MGNKETGDGENWEIEKIDKTREMEKGNWEIEKIGKWGNSGNSGNRENRGIEEIEEMGIGE